MEYKARPTTYAGVNFRSRLEARWAAFFDLCGWPWEYEPVDLELWVPDFRLGGANGSILIEVKPIHWPEDDRLWYALAESSPDLAKVWRSLGSGEIVIVGDSPGVEMLGVFASEAWGAGEDLAVLGASADRPLDFYAHYGSYEYRISGEHDGDHHIRLPGDIPARLWREAGNRTQWRAR